VSRYFHKLFALAIALATAGAQVVCACPTPAVVHQAPPPISQTCAGEKECCRKTEASKPIEPPKQDPCNKCNLKHRTEQAMPDRQDGTFLPQLALCSFVPGPVIDFADISSNQPPLLDTLPLPPLLRDLFHVHSLLLN
jgi:hypothetical protein